MPVDRTVGAQYAERIIAMYLEVEQQLAEIIARGVKRNVEREDLSRKLLQLSEVRRAAEAAMAKIDGKLHATVRQALHDAAVAGGRKAQEDLLKIRDRRAVGRRMTQIDKDLVNSPSILRLAAALTPSLESRLRSTHLQVVRSVGDIYQHAVAAMAAPGVLAGVATRREASQRALDHLWQKGITGFTDKAGRRWNLATYVEMATRTAMAQASVQAHLDELAQNDINLVMVSSDGAPCPRCQPWEGKVLTTGDTIGHQAVTRPSELDGSDTAVRIAGSVAQATADGLFHPSCRHRLVAFLPGLTTAPDTAGEGADVYKAEQQQRALEREARRLAVAQAGAVDPAAVRDLARQYRDKRAQIAQHVKDNPKLRRKTERERINLGHTPGEIVESPKVTPKPKVITPKVAPKVVAPKAPPKAKAAPKATIGPKIKPAGISGPKTPRKTAPKVEAPVKVTPTVPAFARRPTFEQPVLSEGQLKGVYGPRLMVNRAGKDPARLAVQLRGLGQIDKGLHKRMNGFLGEEQYGGIYLGPKGILDTAPVEMRANFHGQPRGYPAGSTYNDVRGCYVPHEHALLIGDDQHPLDGTHSTAQHEFGHAVDHMEGHPSRSQEYKDVYDSLKSSITFKPYFSATGNPSGYHSESFAEFFNAYASQRGKPEQVMVRVMMGQLGFAPAANDIAYAVIKGPEEIARLPRGAREGLVAMRKLIAMLDDITEGKR